MNKTKIKAEIVGHSLSPQGDELISVLCTFPRIILAEVNTHRMLSKNTSSSRAIPFNKMVEAIKNNPFIPIAWQKHHSGMQGNEYHTGEGNVGDINYKARAERNWLRARDFAVEQAKHLYEDSLVTKQLCNRLLEPFMWTTMLITGSREGWNNFFNLRCPQYSISELIDGDNRVFKSKKDFLKELDYEPIYPNSDLDWLKLNKGQAEIHMMALAESIYDAVNESTPKQLQTGEWHVPFGDKIDDNHLDIARYKINGKNPEHAHIERIDEREKQLSQLKLSIATARTARLSYMTFDGEIDYEKDVKLHDQLLESKHFSPFEHCARAMSDKEFISFFKGELPNENLELVYKGRHGWCNNLKGFIPYRYLIDNKIEL